MVAPGSATNEDNNLSATAERFCRRFSLAEVQLATQDFSEAHLIGIGGFGKVYKGLIDNPQLTVAIKRLAPNSNQGEGEFLTEIETLSKLRHVNLVSLIGYCNENGEMILVYEYIPRGALADHLYKLSSSSESDDCSSLTWKQRLNICIGAGRGMDYLHTGTSIIHRDVKSTNILLDENFTAKVADFGLAKHLSMSSLESHVSTIVKGSFGYLDPSYFVTCRLTRKSDIYAFGVVLFEVLCGRPAVDQRLGEDEMSLAMWVQEKTSKGKVRQIVASNLRDDEISDDCLKTFVRIAKRCLSREPKKRPTMGRVVFQLELALQQLGRQTLTLKASRFLPFWNRVKPSGSRATGSTDKDHKQGDDFTLSTSITASMQEEPIKDEHAVKMLHADVHVPAIPIHELKQITRNFSSDLLICKGLNGNIYRGALKVGQVAAIKKLHYHLPRKEFLEQVSLISSLKHENVAQLLGYSVDDWQLFLVYECAQNGSLYDILHGKPGSKPALSWAQRVKIAMEVAKGLEYIHQMKWVHCNITSRNILIYDDEVAKLADFGRKGDNYPLFPPAGYNPPERYDCCSKFSWRIDVYSFGVVLLELLTGSGLDDRRRARGHEHIKNWSTKLLTEDKVEEIVDARLNGVYPPEAVAKMATVAALCLENEAELRPDMSVVVRALSTLLNACSETEMQPEIEFEELL